MPKSRPLVEDMCRTGRYRIARAIRDRIREERRPPNENGGRNREEVVDAVLNQHVVNDDAEMVFDLNIQHGAQVDDDNAEQADRDSSSEDEEPDAQAGPQDENEEESDSSDEEAFEDEEGNGMDFQAPLYFGAPITAAECMLLVLSLMLNHNLTGSCVSDVLEAMNFLCPGQGLQKLSYYKFKKFFKCSKLPCNKKYYCSNCNQAVNRANEVCGLCGDRNNISYFVQLPIVPQLREMYNRESFYNTLQHRINRDVDNHTLDDIYDGAVYKEHVQNGFLANPNNISLTWYTDGVPVFKCKNYSIWPFSYMVNELPFKIRTKQENILLAGLWFGPSKPAANLFMKSFIPDLRRLYAGIHLVPADLGEQILVRGVVLAGVCDAPAKTTFLNFVAHTGFHGCPVCEIQGETLQREGETDKHVYRYEEHMNLRTVENCQLYARRAINSPDPIVGVKGPTALRLMMPNFLRGMGIDFMHLMTGVVKKLLTLHFNSKYSACPFSVRAVIAAADLELQNIKPPKFIHRRPSSLEHYNRWKASELKSWLYYFSVPIYKNILHPEYFNHYLKFVLAVYHLSTNSVSPPMIDVARELLKEFVRDFQVLYDAKFCSINIHMLLHVADCVYELGPEWVYSCFPMENLNGVMLGTVHGKTSIDSQICNGFWQKLMLPRKMERVPAGPLKDFLNKRQRSVKIGERIGDSCYVVGPMKDAGVNHPVIRNGLQASGIRDGHMSQYLRLLKNGMIYVADRYTRDAASRSSFVAFQLGNDIKMGSIFSFIKVQRCACPQYCQCDRQHYAIVRFAEKAEAFTIPSHRDYELPYLHKYQMTMVVRAIPVAQLKTVCVFMEILSSIYVGQPVNTLEVE